MVDTTGGGNGGDELSERGGYESIEYGDQDSTDKVR